MPDQFSQRFWSFVDRSGGPDACWPWTRSRMPRGYGQLNVAGRHLYSHRVAWALANGPIPAGALIRHSCDNPPCCNPAHLSPGTKADNAQDASRRGRLQRDSEYWAQPGRRLTGRMKLTEDQAKAILAELQAPVSAGHVKARDTDIGRRYGVAEQSIRHMRAGRSWRNLPR